jgi:RND family efflux transporter MFP subunit
VQTTNEKNPAAGAIGMLLALSLAACSGNAASDAPDPAASAPILIGKENVVTVTRDTIVAGPIISGELRPEREAVLRAQLGGSMLEVALKEGQAVRKGAVLGRIDARSLEDARTSARSAVRSAENQVQVAERELKRAEQLVAAGALAAREVDLARNTLTTAEAQLADARARLVAADKQLADAVIEAPISGIVAERAVNAGDVVAPGTELFTIVDPSSMRLEASVPSESLPDLRVGAAVQFEVRGYKQPFTGRLARIAPQTDAATRQLPIYVEIPNVEGRLVGGLFAEGRVVTQSAEGLVIPANAVNTSGPEPWVLRVADGKTERRTVSLGLRDPRTERVQVTSGLSEHDVVLRGAAQGIEPGTPVQVTGKQ